MYFSDRVKLVSATMAMDEIGNPLPQELEREVWADVQSVSRAEFTAAGANGLKPSMVVKVHETDYRGERLVVMGGVRYAVYRDYRKGEDRELYVEKRMGEKNGRTHENQ